VALTTDPTSESTPQTERSDPRQIGTQLRALRLAAGLTLRTLASRAGVTASLLSQIETGRAHPSVQTLFSLAESLGVPVADLFSAGPSVAELHRATSGPVVRSQSRNRIELENGVEWESLLPEEEHGLEFMAITYPPGAVSAERMQRHGGRDYGIVTRGSLTVELGFSTFTLSEGDSIAFDATTPHRLRNDTASETVAVWLVMERHATP
jgi:transcriptional regulator with XRE-family HTH domain